MEKKNKKSTNNNNNKEKEKKDKEKDKEKEPEDVNLLAENISELRMTMENIRNKNSELTKVEKFISLFKMIKNLSTIKILKEDYQPVELIPNLFIGSIGTASNLKILKETGITHIVCAAKGVEAYYPNKFTYLKLDLLDTENEDIKKYFDEAGEFINKALKEKGKVLVHCHAGISRSSTICLAYIIKYKKIGYDKAIKMVREKRSKISPNVGFEKQLTMYSLDFEEFLWAKGYDDKKISYLLELFKSNSKVPHEINEKYEELFREFIVVGGMPEVVANFVENNDFSKVQAIQDKIMTSYYSDISLHAKGIEKVKVRKCFESIPRQLAKENKKFQYSKVESGKTSRYFSDSIQWLKDSGLVNVSHNVTQPYIPLGANEIDENFKLYYHDTGLLCSTYGFETKLAILNNTIKGNSKGGIYENVIGELLVKKGYSLRYKKEENNTLEIEFLIEQNGEVIPIEVKASNGSTFSLNDYINKWSPTICYKLISGNIGLTDKKKSIPHYMVMFI